MDARKEIVRLLLSTCITDGCCYILLTCFHFQGTNRGGSGIGDGGGSGSGSSGGRNSRLEFIIDAVVCLASLGAVPEDKGFRLWSTLEQSVVSPLAAVPLQRDEVKKTTVACARRSPQQRGVNGEMDDSEEGDAGTAVNEDERTLSEEGGMVSPDNDAAAVLTPLRGVSILGGGRRGISTIASMMDAASRAGFKAPSWRLASVLVSEVRKLSALPWRGKEHCRLGYVLVYPDMPHHCSLLSGVRGTRWTAERQGGWRRRGGTGGGGGRSPPRGPWSVAPSRGGDQQGGWGLPAGDHLRGSGR